MAVRRYAMGRRKLARAGVRRKTIGRGRGRSARARLPARIPRYVQLSEPEVLSKPRVRDFWGIGEFPSGTNPVLPAKGGKPRARHFISVQYPLQGLKRRV